MSNIDKRELREVAEKALPAMMRLLMNSQHLMILKYELLL